MTIGVSTYSFQKYKAATGCDLFALCDKAKELGFDHIDFADQPTDVKVAEELRVYCERIGLPIGAYSVGANFLAEDIETELARLRGAVDVAAALGVTVMRHDATFSLPRKHLYSYRDAIREMAPRIREIADYAEAKGVRTCSENHGFIFQAPERVEELILAVGHTNYGWLCDIGNFLCADADPVRAVAIAAPYTFHVHVKDFIVKPGILPKPDGFMVTAGGNYLRGTVIGHGDVPIKNCITALKKGGYDGKLTIEFEGLEDNIKALEYGLSFLRRAVNEQ